MNENSIYKELGRLTDSKDEWKEAIPYVGSLLDTSSVKIKAKVLWLLGEFGLQYPNEVIPFLDQIAELLENENNQIRERAVDALGRIGRADYLLISPYWEKIMALSEFTQLELSKQPCKNNCQLGGRQAKR